jgi:hypothetical protein
MPWGIAVIKQCKKSVDYLDLMVKKGWQGVWRAERTMRAVGEGEVMERRLLLIWRQEVESAER